ncbi:MAG: tyrosine-type recombinase/integrase [Steroidobacteraceae bacterium]
MNNSTRAVSPLRQRMIEDMRMRKLSPKTRSAYIRSVRQFARYLRRSPDTASIEDLRNYQLHLVDSGTSPISLNAAITGLKFFFGVTLDRGAMMAKMQHVFVPRTLPIVLSREEVKRLIAASDNLKRPDAHHRDLRAHSTHSRTSVDIRLNMSAHGSPHKTSPSALHRTAPTRTPIVLPRQMTRDSAHPGGSSAPADRSQSIAMLQTVGPSPRQSLPTPSPALKSP